MRLSLLSTWRLIYVWNNLKNWELNYIKYDKRIKYHAKWWYYNECSMKNYCTCHKYNIIRDN